MPERRRAYRRCTHCGYLTLVEWEPGADEWHCPECALAWESGDAG